jgi:hypothetical protein
MLPFPKETGPVLPVGVDGGHAFGLEFRRLVQGR